jgi:hypothetical protein
MEKGRTLNPLIILSIVWFLAIVSLMASFILLFGAIDNRGWLLPAAICSLSCLFFWSFACWEKKGDIFKKYGFGTILIFLTFLSSSVLYAHSRYSIPFPSIESFLWIVVLAFGGIYLLWLGLVLKHKFMNYYA